jgi:hypothetical protein
VWHLYACVHLFLCVWAYVVYVCASEFCQCRTSELPFDDLFSSLVLQYYGLEVEAVQGPIGSRLGSLVPLAVLFATERSMASVAGVFDNFLGPSSDTAWYRGPGWQGARTQ